MNNLMTCSSLCEQFNDLLGSKCRFKTRKKLFPFKISHHKSLEVHLCTIPHAVSLLDCNLFFTNRF